MSFFNFNIDLLAASIAMTVTLSFGIIPNAYTAYHPNPTDTISSFCKIRSYVVQSSSMIYRWLIVMACIDRYMSSSESIVLRGLANPRIAYRIVLINVIIWIILPVHNLIFLDIWESICGFPLVAVAIYHSIFTIVFGTLLPLLIMIICAVFIRFNLASKRERRQHNIGQQNREQAVRLLLARDQQALFMLFIEVICFSLSAMPYAIFLLYNAFTREVTITSINRIVIVLFLRYITEMIAYIDPTLSFYIYALASDSFRRHFIKTIRLILNYRNRRAVHPQRIVPNIGNP
jgi:hypothetical protein